MGTSMLGTAAALAKKKAELTALNNGPLPRVYQQIGRRIAGMAKLPPALASHVERIRQLEASVGASHGTADVADAGGFAAKAKQLAQKAAKATSDAATTLQINSAYTTLGREAVLKYGEKAVPKELAAELATLTTKQQKLAADIASLEASHAGGVVTPKRLVLAATLGAVLLGAFFVVRTVGSLISGGRQAVVLRPAVPDMPDPRDAARQSQPPKPTFDSLGGLADTAKQLRDLQENLSDAATESNRGAEENAFAATLGLWKSKVQDRRKPLSEDGRIRSLLSGSADGLKKAIDKAAIERDQEIAALLARSDFAIKQQATLLQSKGGVDLDQRLEQLRTAVHEESEKVDAARSEAIASLVTLAKAIGEKHQRLLKELQSKYEASIATWSEKVTALAAIEDDKAITSLPMPKDPAQWKGHIRDVQDKLAFDLKYLADQKKDAGIAWAQDAASRFVAVGDEQTALSQAMNELSSVLEKATTEAEAKRAEMLTKAVSLHDASMKEQLSRDAHEQAVRDDRGRSYEAPEDLTDADLVEIIKEAPDLTDLDLIRATRLTDACLPAVASLKGLRSLYLSSPTFNTDENALITVKGLSLLKGKKLKYLTFPARLLSDDDGFGIYASMLADVRFSHGELWRLDQLRLTDAAIEHLNGKPRVFGLTLPHKITDRGLQALQHIPDLQRVDFFLTKEVTDAGIRSLAKCRNLKMIMMWLPDGVVDVHVTPAAIEALKGMNLAWFVVPQAMHTEEFFGPVLDTLSSEEVRVGDGGTQEAELMRREVTLVDPREAFDREREANNPDRLDHPDSTMWQWPCTPTVLKACEGKAGITTFEIKECQVDENALMALGSIPDLKDVLITKTNITGRGLKTLAKAKTLESVYISDCPDFGHEGIAALAQCDAMAKLTLINVPSLNDTDLLMLKDCGGLRWLSIAGSGASKTLIFKMQKLMPECQITINP